jgi:hypothetical protein
VARGKRRSNATGRNEGVEQYFPLVHVMARSPAWRSLSGPAIKVFCELRCRYNGSNNGDLSLSLDEATRLLHIGKATAKRAFEELSEKGFLVLTHRGRWCGRMAATWRVTDRVHNGQPATRDWQRWTPKASAEKPCGTVADHKRHVVVRDRTTKTLCGPLQYPSAVKNAL